MSSDRDVSDIHVYIVSVVMTFLISSYSVQCLKNSADCHVYMLTAVGDEIKLFTVESYMC